MSSSKKLTCKETGFAAAVYLSEAQNSYPLPPFHTIRVYSTLIRTGKGGGGRVEPERMLELRGATVHKAR
jgi:hypothetical protein